MPELSRPTQAENETGAGIMASMATSAMSSANAIAHTIITESA